MSERQNRRKQATVATDTILQTDLELRLAGCSGKELTESRGGGKKKRKKNTQYRLQLTKTERS